jgi:hypothetical protein
MTQVAHNRPDGRCRWTYGDQRCPAPATIARTTRAVGAMYCRWHRDVRDVEEGKRILEQLLRDGVPQDGSDWRDQLVEARMRDRCKSLDELLCELDPTRRKPASNEDRAALALEIYRDRRRTLELRGMDRQSAHEKAVTAVYAAGTKAAERRPAENSMRTNDEPNCGPATADG